VLLGWQNPYDDMSKAFWSPGTCGGIRSLQKWDIFALEIMDTSGSKALLPEVVIIAFSCLIVYAINQGQTKAETNLKILSIE